MYSEITVEHRETIGEEASKALIVESFKNSIDLGEAYDRTEVYQRRKPVSICAFESGPNCFVILRKVTDIRFSIYHFEGNHPTVTLPTMLEGVQEFVGELTALLNGKTVGPAYHPRKVTLRLFEERERDRPGGHSSKFLVSFQREIRSEGVRSASRYICDSRSPIVARPRQKTVDGSAL